MSKEINVTELEVSEALNSLTTANLRDAVGDSALRELIKDYFCSGDQSDASSDSEYGDEDGNGNATEELPDTRDKQPDLEDDSNAPVVTVDVVSSELYSSGGGGETVCDAADEELERVKKFMCGCSKSCYNQLTHEKVLKWRLDMKELTEGNFTSLLIMHY